MEIGNYVQNVNDGSVGCVIAIDDQGEFVSALVENVKGEYEVYDNRKCKFVDVNDLRIVEVAE